MIIATDKSIVISGPKHGSSETIEIFREYLESFNYSSPSYTTDFRDISIGRFNHLLKYSIHSKNSSLEHLDQISSEYFPNKDHFAITNPIKELLNCLAGKSDKKIFIFIRDPFKSFKTALLQDLSLSIGKNPLKFYKEFNFYPDKNKAIFFDIKHLQIMLPNQYKFKEIISSCISLYYEELTRGPHLCNLHLNSTLNFLFLTKSFYPSAIDSITIVDLDNYSEEHIPYLVSMKVFRQNEKREYLSSNKLSLDVLDNLLDERLENLPCYGTRYLTEEAGYSFIKFLFRKNLV